jgi:hypothetical protein
MQPPDDNFGIALEYCLYHTRHHKFLDSSPHETQRLYVGYLSVPSGYHSADLAVEAAFGGGCTCDTFEAPREQCARFTFVPVLYASRLFEKLRVHGQLRKEKAMRSLANLTVQLVEKNRPEVTTLEISQPSPAPSRRAKFRGPS